MKRKLSYFFKEEKALTFFVVFFGITFNVSQIFSPIFLGKLIDSLAEDNPFDLVVKNVIVYLSVITGIMILRFFKRYLVRLFANRTSRRMRSIMYENTIHESLEFIESHTIGDLMSRCISDCDSTVEGIRKSLTEIFDTGVLMTSYFVTLLIYDWKTTLIASLFIPVSIGIAYLLKKTIYQANKEYRKEDTKASEKTFLMVDNASDLRNHGAFDNVVSEYEEELKVLKRKQIKAFLLEGSMEPMYKSIAYLGIIFVLYFASCHAMNQDSYFLGIWTVGACISYLKLYTSFAKKASKVSKLINTVTRAKVSYERIAPYLVLKEYEKGSVSVHKENSLSVENLTVSHDGHQIIRDVSFTGKPGEIIGVTGPVGSGKSTLGLAMTGLIPYEGHVKLGEYEISRLSSLDIHELISYQGHNPYLLSDTISENIRLGEDISVDEPLKNVAFTKDLEAMKDKTETRVGQNGIRLSGGQKQRLAMARALAKPYNLIILDDPLSASDMETEEEILENLKEGYKDSVILFISHRLSIFPHTDKVIFLGREGTDIRTHEDLIRENSEYRELYTLQKEGFSND